MGAGRVALPSARREIFDNIPGHSDTFSEAPGAIGDLGLEPHHLVVARDSSGQFIHNGTNVDIP